MSDYEATPEEKNLSAAFERLVEACGGPKRADSVLNARLGRCYGASRFSKWVNPNYHDSAPLHVVQALETHCGKPIVTAAMLHPLDAVAIVLPTTPVGELDFHTLTARAMESDHLCKQTMFKSLANGKVSPDEALEALPIVTQDVTDDLALKIALERVAGVG